MRHAATAISLCMALISGMVLAQVWALDPTRSPTIPAVTSSAVEETALTFYQAVNTYFDGGDDAALRRILHPDFVTYHSGSSVAGNGADFMQQLDSIRHLYPGIQLAAEVVYLGSNAASVSLSVSNQKGGAFAGIGVDPIDVIGRLDLVRIERKLIVERWSSATLAGNLDAFPALSIELPIAIDTLVARVQQISLDGASEPTINPFGHLLMIAQSGQAYLDVMDPAKSSAVIWRVSQGRVAGPTPIEPTMTVTLGQMEAVFVPAGTRFRMWDSGSQDAALTVLEFGPAVSGDIPSTPPLLDALGETLSSGISLTGVGDRLTLSFGQATLPPQATLSSEQVKGLELTWVSGGSIEMAASSGAARVRDGSGVRSQLDGGHALLQAGYAGAAGPGSEVTYRATGNTSATVWFFSLVPTGVETSENEAGAPTPIPTAPPVRNVS
jgi:hypothetical protein